MFECLSSHQGSLLVMTCGCEVMAVSRQEQYSENGGRGQYSSKWFCISGCVGHQGQWKGSFKSSLCIWVLRQPCSILSLVITMSRVWLEKWIKPWCGVSFLCIVRHLSGVFPSASCSTSVGWSIDQCGVWENHCREIGVGIICHSVDHRVTHKVNVQRPLKVDVNIWGGQLV